jgi:hypothetical protein
MSTRQRWNRVGILLIAFMLLTSNRTNAQTPTPHVAIVSQILSRTFADLGLGPHTVTMSRIVFTPGTAEDAVALPGVRLIFVESGSLTFHASGDDLSRPGGTDTGSNRDGDSAAHTDADSNAGDRCRAWSR